MKNRWHWVEHSDITAKEEAEGAWPGRVAVHATASGGQRSSTSRRIQAKPTAQHLQPQTYSPTILLTGNHLELNTSSFSSPPLSSSLFSSQPLFLFRQSRMVKTKEIADLMCFTTKTGFDFKAGCLFHVFFYLFSSHPTCFQQEPRCAPGIQGAHLPG